jgi:hypothetical protein
MLPPTNTNTFALITRINEITSEQSRLEVELANLSRELSGRPVKQQQQQQQQPISHHNQDRDPVDIIDNSVSSDAIIATTVDNKKRSRGRPRKDISTIVSSALSNIINNVNHGDGTFRMNYDGRGIGIVMNGAGEDADDGAYYFVDCGRVFICNSGGVLFDMKTRELVGWRNTYLNRVDFVDII